MEDKGAHDAIFSAKFTCVGGGGGNNVLKMSILFFEGFL